jgi:hypothetical protein
MAALSSKARVSRAVVRGLALAVALLVAASLAAAPAGAHRRPVVIPQIAKSYGYLSAVWWQQVFRIPAATNPLLDTTGAHCADGQRGPVFFLHGFAGAGSVERNCTVPKRKALFFPLVNAFDLHIPCPNPACDENTTPQGVWDELHGAFNFRVDSLYARVDGVAVPNLDPASNRYRGCAGPDPACGPRSFPIRLPADNLLSQFAGGTLPPGVYSPTVADGFYLLLAPLRPGRHELEFGGTGSGGAQDITYHLVVR